jgi:hypothetical protein
MKTASAKPNSLEFKQNLPFIKKGLDLDQVWFSGGRLATTILRHGGIGEVLYYGRQSLGHAHFFKAANPTTAWEKLFRLCVVIDGAAWYPEFNHTTFHPFGYTSECVLAGVHLRHELAALNDALVQRVKVLANPAKKKLSLRVIFHGMSRVEDKFRTWKPWKATKDGLTTAAIDELSKEEIKRQIDEKMADVRDHFPVSDTPYGETHIGFVSDRTLSVKTARKNWKYYVSSGSFTDQAAITLAFAPGAAAFNRRCAELKKSVHRECDDLFALFHQRQQLAPAVRIPGEPVVESCLAHIPRVVDAVEVKDIPGGFRAGMQNYWVWLDLMLDSVSFLYANDSDSLRDMILLFNGKADKKLGIPCLLTTHMTPLLGTPFNNQCPFITTVYNYYCYTGDEKTLRACYPVMRFLIEKCLKKEVRGTGLIEGAGNPDHPAEQDGHDIASCNNSYFYQALMAMRFLSREMTRLTGDKEHEKFGRMCAEVGARCCKNFIRYFFDKKKGYFLDSLSSRDFSPRRHYPSFVIQWTTPFAADLVAGNEKRIAEFLAKTFTRPHGIASMFPTWDKDYPGDGNQWLAYYPSWTESFYRSTMKLAGRERELRKLFGIIGWFWQRYTIPEGFTYDAENEGFTPDNPGGKQPFGAQAWYGNFFRCIVGFEVDERGVIISASPVQDKIVITNLIVRGKRIDLTVTGKGRKAEVIFNGKTQPEGKVIIPFFKLKARNEVVIRRTS